MVIQARGQGHGDEGRRHEGRRHEGRRARPPHRLVGAPVAIGLLVPLALGVVTPAAAQAGITPADQPGAATAAEGVVGTAYSAVAGAALDVARAQLGDPYLWGAQGPDAFDCSGLVVYAYGAAGVALPRTADAQFRALAAIPSGEARPGDLVFFHDSPAPGSHVHHVGFYVGDGTILHAPHPGAVVRYERIWSSWVTYGRVAASPSAGAEEPGNTTDAGTAGASSLGDLRVVDANIRTNMPRARWTADLATVLARDPDVVTLQEMDDRSDAEIRDAAPGYDLWRMPDQRGDVYAQSRGTVVLWRSDSYEPVRKGRVTLTAAQARLDNRYAQWVTLRERETGATFSVISAHAMTNPRGDTARQRLDAAGFRRLADLVDTLERSGPVVLGGDLNVQYRGQADVAWGPRTILSRAQMTEVKQQAGRFPESAYATHDGGGSVDYVFTTDGLRATEVHTVGLHSDHRAVVADLDAD